MRTRLERQIKHTAVLQSVRKPSVSLTKTRKEQRKEVNKPETSL
jgi:hypothetical protein